MGTLLRRVLLILLSTQFLEIVTASTLEPFFYVRKDDPALGGCTPAQVTWLEESYTEAIDMIRGAMADLDFIGRGGRKTMPKDSPDRKRWDKTSAMLIDMFDIRVHTLHGIRDKSQADRMKTLKKVLDSLQSSADLPTPDANLRKKIFCGYNMITHLKPDDEIPVGVHKGEKISERFPIKHNPDGVFYQPGKMASRDVVDYYPIYQPAKARTPGSRISVAEYFCPPGNLARTSYRRNRFIFCPEAFNLVAKAETDKVFKDSLLDYYKSGSRVLVHELVHLWQKDIPDVFAVDASVPKKKKVARPKSTTDKVYYWDACGDLALDYPQETVQTAENFAMFAAGQYFKDWRWHDPHGEAIEATEPLKYSP